MNGYLGQVLSAAFPSGMRGRTPEQLRGDMGGMVPRLQALPWLSQVPQSTWGNLNTQVSGMLGQPAPQLPQQPQQATAPVPSPAAGGLMQNRLGQLGMHSPFDWQGDLSGFGQSYGSQGGNSLWQNRLGQFGNRLRRPLTVSDWR